MITASLPQPKIQDHENFPAILGTVAKCARERFPDHGERIDKAIQLVIDGAVMLCTDGSAVVRSQTSPTVSYSVTDSCTCRDAEPWCKHRLGTALLKRVTQRLAEVDATAHAECWQPVDEDGTPCHMVEGACQHTPLLADEPLTADAALLAPYVVHIHGRPFVQYAGLLKLATARGLTGLSARFISVTLELALAEATATFADGRVFSEAADATPANVNKKVAPHFARCALTRAKARCLRDALGIDMTALEELGE